ncbi:MAG: sensor histidine kinase [Holosporales bacterium]|jgi:signal transduction histidine kinase
MLKILPDIPGTDASFKEYLSPWSLRFHEEAMEDKFNEDFYASKKSLLQFVSILAVVVYGLFGVLDYYVTPDYKTMWIIRFFVGMPVVVFNTIVLYCDLIKKYQRSITIINVWIVGISVELMMVFGDTFVAANYFYGINVVIFYGSMLFFISFRRTLPLCSSLIVLYGVLNVTLISIEQRQFISNLVFMTVGGIFSVLAVYLHELYARVNFVTNIMLARASIAAQAASVTKSNFLALMSHELRTPVVAMRGMAELVNGKILGDSVDPYIPLARDAIGSVDRLLVTIANILDYAALTTGDTDLKDDDITVDQIVAHILEEGIATDKIVLDIAPRLRLRLDIGLWTAALRHVLGNAVRFTPNGGRVRLRVQDDEIGGVGFYVEDQGLGLAPEQLARVTLAFEQVTDPYKREEEGLGLGLPFVRTVAEKHGGRFAIVSTPGFGTMVKLWLPEERVVREVAEVKG